MSREFRQIEKHLKNIVSGLELIALLIFLLLLTTCEVCSRLGG